MKNIYTYLRLFIVIFAIQIFAINSSAIGKKPNKSPIKTASFNVNVETSEGVMSKLNFAKGSFSVVKTRFNHEYNPFAEWWSALNNNIVCSLQFDFEINTANIDLKKINSNRCMLGTEAALLKLDGKLVKDIKNQDLYYFVNNKWIHCKELFEIPVTNEKLKVRINIPVLNSELQHMNRINTQSINKVRVLFANGIGYLDYKFEGTESAHIYQQVNEIARINYKQKQSDEHRSEMLRGF